MLSKAVAALLAVGVVGCTISDATTSSLVDLAATTAGGFVQIVVTAALEGLLMFGPVQTDLNAPISEQSH